MFKTPFYRKKSIKKNYVNNFVADAYKDLLFNLKNNPEYVTSPRGQKCKEITDVRIEIKQPNYNLFKNKKRSSPLKYIAAEIFWYFSGKNDIEFISQYAQMWDKIKNDDGTVNSAYGHLIFAEKNKFGFSQYEWALKSLKKDKDTRQAFLHFNNSTHQFFENKDQVCTMYGIFQIRNNELNFSLNMRSNDAILGLMTDFAFFNILHQQMFLHLKEYYEDLKMGSYTHFSNSLHIYERHFKLVEEMLQHDFEVDSLPELFYDLIDETGYRTLATENNFETTLTNFLN